MSYLRLLQVLLDIDLVTEVVCLNSSPGLVGPKPLSVEDGALYPLGSRGAQCLTTVISGLLLQVRIHFMCLSLFLPDDHILNTERSRKKRADFVFSFCSLSFLGILKNEYVLIDPSELIWDEKKKPKSDYVVM